MVYDVQILASRGQCYLILRDAKTILFAQIWILLNLSVSEPLNYTE